MNYYIEELILTAVEQLETIQNNYDEWDESLESNIKILENQLMHTYEKYYHINMNCKDRFSDIFIQSRDYMKICEDLVENLSIEANRIKQNYIIK